MRKLSLDLHRGNYLQITVQTPDKATIGNTTYRDVKYAILVRNRDLRNRAHRKN